MDKARISEILKQLVAVDGPSGSEGKVADLVQSLAGDLVSEVRRDALGNLILYQRGAAEPPGRVMLAAHIDEIALVVTKIEQGFLHVGSIGGIGPRSVIGQEVTVYPSGPGSQAYLAGISGYVGSRPIHLLSADERNEVIPLRNLRVDLGLPPTFFENGIVRVGDRVVVRGPQTELLGGRLATKALDNRAGVAVMLGALGYVLSMQHIWDVYAVATTQEEIGLRGATAAAFGVDPDLAIALDVTFGDTPGVNSGETFPMDHGPTIGLGPNLHPGVVKQLEAVADDLEIPYSIEPMPGSSGTDAWAIQVSRAGIPTGVLSVPVRYMHSPVETVVLSDLDRTARLLAAFIARLDASTLDKLAAALS
jgi:putative aminopeptidase FrvX